MLLQISPDLITAFIAATGITGYTARNYTQAIHKFTACHLPLNADCLHAFRAALLADPRHYTKATRDAYIAGFKRFLQWLDAHDLIDFSFAKAVSKLKSSRGRERNTYQPRIPDPDLVCIADHISAHLTGNNPQLRIEAARDHAIIRLLFSTAMRAGEIATLTRHQLHNGRSSDIIFSGKGGKTRTVFVDPESRAAITTYLALRADKCPALFVSHRFNAGQPITSHTIHGIVYRAGQTNNIHATPHLIRHWVATDMLNRGVALEIVQEYLGHADISTTRRVYAHVRPLMVREAWNKYRRDLRRDLAAAAKSSG